MRCTAGSSFLLRPGVGVAFVPPVLDAPRRATVEAVSAVDGMKATVRFSGLDGNDAHALAGCHVLVRRADFSERELSGEDPIVGFTVVDAALGEIGAVSGVVDNPGQALLEVGRADGSTALVPFAEGIVTCVDEDAKRIDIVAPAGLFDL